MARFASDPVSSAEEQKAEVVSDSGKISFSIIICTKDRPRELAHAIDTIRNSCERGRSAEIIVVDESETPREIPGVHYFHHRRAGRGFGYSRNMGVQKARGDLILFIDDDCEAERGWVDNLIAPLVGNPNVLGVAGAVLVHNCGLIGYAENILGFPGGGLRYLNESRGQIVQIRYLSTCNCAYRREAVLEAGGFPEEPFFKYPGGEDSLLAERVSRLGPCVYTPDAVVYHRPRGRFGAIFRWFIQRGLSEVAVARVRTRFRDTVAYFLRSSWTLRLLALLPALAYWPRLAVLLPVAVAFYYTAMLWRFRFARAYPTHRNAWWLVPIVKLAMDLGTEVGRWKAVMAR